MKFLISILLVLSVVCSCQNEAREYLGSSEVQEQEQDTIKENPYPNPPQFNLACICFYDQGGQKANGAYTLYYENGNVKSVTTYQKGQHAELLWYYENGQLHQYQSGDSLLIVYYEDGVKWDVGRWKDGEHNGIDTLWYPNGQIKRLKEWNMGDVLWLKEYDEQGNLTKSKEF